MLEERVVTVIRMAPKAYNIKDILVTKNGATNVPCSNLSSYQALSCCLQQATGPPLQCGANKYQFYKDHNKMIHVKCFDTQKYKAKYYNTTKTL